MKPARIPLVLLVSLLLASCLAAAGPANAEILQVLSIQADAWNRGDIDGFMKTYAQTPELRFASGAAVTYGWKPTLERYKQRYPDRAAMGTLAFSELVVTELSADAAVVFGHWQLTRAKDTPHGLFTLLVRRTADGWRIFADHTSAAP
ncbi:MAG: hypothetical protein JWM32_1851 [Verrucomicrobia bacterium]|nr:hypothetical protein [Verrucomicrobiota bacterium]